MAEKPKKNYSTSTFLNEVFRGFGNYAYHSKALTKLSPENQDLFLTTYQDSLGLKYQIKTQDHLARYTENYHEILDSFPDITFDRNPKELKDLANSLHTLDLAIQNIGARFHPDNLTQYLTEERTKVRKMLETQHKNDIQKIEETYAANPAKRKDALARLQSAQQAQLKTIEEKLTRDINALHKAVAEERRRVSTFAALRHENEHMRKIFDEIYLKGDPSEASISLGGEGGVFKDLDFDKLVDYANRNFGALTGRNLGSFQTFTGRDLQVEQTTGKDPSRKAYKFNINLPNISKVHAGFEDLQRGNFSFSSTSYYSDPSNRAMQDLLVIANLLKLSGEENPYAEINGFSKNPDMAMKIAQDAFAALRMVGYPEDKIKIIVNGKTYTMSDKENNFDAIFKTNPRRRQEIAQQVGMHEKNIESIDNMRNEMDAERKKYEAPTPATPVPPAGSKKGASATKTPVAGSTETETPASTAMKKKIADTEDHEEGPEKPRPPGGGIAPQ